ncbi:DUF3151 domain-containing protein [Rothia aerolata]|uniref:DUF3151 domain-containing protein n=1 Tax=Rothia aerolata TaxID=1812262 RepID=A0A917MW91_9MICC|nr:DUF3151 domain-containing protein [Rothia aerolata]GGH64472.1 hypothetical protein GCM10007359_16800 [Rothia aerolata]
MSLAGKNLLEGPEPTYLPKEAELEIRIAAGDEAEDLVKAFPKSSLAWALLAEDALKDGRTVEGYAYARVGYHRGLDSLRANGWKGHGPIPFSHEPNRGFLKALYLLGGAAAAIGEEDEAQRIENFLNDSDPEAKSQLSR